MTVLTSTYRLQFRGDVTFDKATELVPYLKDLGISHVYASPILAAKKGSTHGYDVTDANEIDPVLGGRERFDAFCMALQQASMGLILDIVPNHMAASVENAWWRDVLQRGSGSAYAGHFDIDWRRKLTLPLLGHPFEESLAGADFDLRYEPADGRIYLAYFDNLLPLSAESAERLAADIGMDAERLRAFSRDAAAMRKLLAEQHWQLLYWKDAAENLSYRRFFEVAGLVGMRVEDARVFDDTHRLIIELVRAGQVQGLRVDHIDGLADPKGYLEHLRQAVGPDTFIVVEKILAPGETLPADWPVSGTTGYEFIAAMADLFVNEEGLRKLDEAYRSVSEEDADFAAGLRRAKLLMVERNFADETRRLASLACSIFPDFDTEEIAAALRELLVAFPVYRTYGYRGAASSDDVAVIESACEKVRSRLPTIDAVNALGRLLKGDVAAAEALEFRARFQQLSGPIMAKAVEDTLFYRYNRLIALNEVGGEPHTPPGSVAAFHQFMTDRFRRQRRGLSATSTHDTKRGEDARARLYGLTQDTDAWIAGVERWRNMNSPFRSSLADGPAPEPNIEWMLYQALAGIWPQDIERADRSALKERFCAYALKAIREAKLRTDWMDENPSYEHAVQAYAAASFSEDSREFIRDFDRTLRPFMEFGFRNSLAQLLIKLTAPGIPDIYQGTEGLDFSLVDPDNRRPVGYLWTDTEAAGPLASDAASLKRHVIRKVLRYRNQHPLLFLEGEYVPLETSGPRASNLVAFARVHERGIAITIVPRLVDMPSSDFWKDTAVTMPRELKGPLYDLLTDKPSAAGNLLAAQLFADHSLSLLVGDR
ncbi:MULTISPECIES: malto-oligosyltrehalose synthase [unclassified Rhizobium]|uniref:malto-oligosyltrehalose synthase n=1 Tax=unclassified Rhizobium TaxID=2613769 RepID=UPI0016163FC7|nr:MULTISPECIES: malto-oligosyltrehalose synthase [unclassified Rhizobium]MBB3286775.1 (1->4)-alpha-D-glucan 1-alpha-D-glucosylmutase [Rhizobium sp. BK252]MBB3401515.1 (1->4)-alpha-D-glucan 1-alpha-D-glucosylmutase [Rhizobium sp. BK289]MBB3414540.1 (1->4)-alpha-D-glucan 1-alpha-D-glucosylmutase [Rhizobium sp. BK284]MBB3482429.1 (1->4)-alpha-D-glucan 1-alpha-D-glucosylmutase [Rhizobium sp. BK347]MDK4718274.1 malto-oligosyltrehalose synthase [Rhizobium sp. CNPSo 3968]